MAAGKQKRRQIPIVKGMLGVVAFGACLGVALAWVERRTEQKKLEEIQQIPDKLSPVLFPEAPSAPREETQQAAWPVDSPGPLPAMEGLPVYPGSMPQSFHSLVVADGQPLEMARFFTEDSVEQLRAFYEQAFRLRGLPFVSHEFSPQTGYIGYMDWPNEELHLISYIRQGNQTMVFPSRSRPAQRSEEGELPAGVPVHPKRSMARTVAFLEPEGSHRISHSATIADERLASVRQFYREALVANGWRNIQEKEEGGRIQLEAAHEKMVANFSFEQKHSDVGIYLLLVGTGPER